MSQRSGKRSNLTKTGLKRLLRNRFGLNEFRPGQEEVIQNVLRGIDTLAVMPTGAGKSLCYQLSSLALPGMTVVISPLIALMDDQAKKLESHGVDIAVLNSTKNRLDEMQALNEIAEEKNEIIFLTPERLQTPEVLKHLSNILIDILVIDEAHCISQWGHDFRPAFLEIPYVLKSLGNPPILALTATATEEVAQDICTQLGRPQMKVINASVYRPNLHFSVKQVSKESEKMEELERILQNVKGSIIIYTATVKAAEAVYGHLQQANYPVQIYHGRMRSEQRRQAQEQFMTLSNNIMVATNAFGLGIDKPDVRAVIHYQMPSSVEAYYQEAGRAGRDDQIAKCILLFNHNDRRIQNFFLAGQYITPSDIQQLWQTLVESATSFKTVSELAKYVKKLPSIKVRVVFKALRDEGFVKVERGKYVLLQKKLSDDDAVGLAENYNKRYENDRIKLEQLISYAFNARCRWLNIVEYFGETFNLTNCGTCDNCMNPPIAVKESDAVTIPKLQSSLKKSKFELGQKVKVRKYGEGSITAIAGEIVTITFLDGVNRSFLSSSIKSY
ncbi:RecQ family ATP-dependent DNA helicase [Nitrosomonas communis]|uniref:ATP-dependent DNA helicase RecQ n=1 Tax=Nitrosomonas communis TaxID=44574 RepID=A0A1H2PWQ7_9PROT|nr:RecQ family ATP-dependent DNA helicase [Nitrosomonas communis]SDV99275.1 ATP-dependent DNA helicase RecQ [Nitrosomonas communis]